MPAVDPTTARRYKVTYAGPFGVHTMLFHNRASDTLENLRGDVSDVIDQMLPLTYDGTTFNKAEYAVPGSTFFVIDSEWVTKTRTGGVDPDINAAPSTFIQWGGRSPEDGVRTKLYLFETPILPRDDMRYGPGENADVDQVITELNSVDTELSTVSGSGVVWYNYANVGQNDYLTHRARRS